MPTIRCLVSCVVVAAVLCSGCDVQKPERTPPTHPPPTTPMIRTWTDDTGQFQVDAIFIEFTDGLVHLQKRDGKRIKVPPERLSEVDNEWFRDIVKHRETDRWYGTY